MTARRATLLALVLATVACRDDTSTPAARLAALRTADDRRTVDEWLLCEECTDGELDSVVALGDRAVPLLDSALEGPTPERRANMRRQAEAMWRGMQDTTVVALQRFLDHYDANYVASYQSRAATALDSIGSPQARQILDEALRSDSIYRPDVRRVLGRSVNARLSLVAGDSQQAALDSFVKVNPQVSIQDSVTGVGLERVRVVFNIDSGGGRVFDSVEFTDTAGRAEVRWQLGPEPQDSINLLRVVAAGRAVRFHARAYRPGLRVEFKGQPRNAKVDEPLLPAVRIEIVDAWGVTQTQINEVVTITVVGTTISSVHRVVAGVAQIPGLSMPKPGAGLVLRAEVPGAEPAVSTPFDIVP